MAPEEPAPGDLPDELDRPVWKPGAGKRYSIFRAGLLPRFFIQLLVLTVSRQDLRLAEGEGFATRGPERDAANESRAFEAWGVGGEGQ
jgi:hypothetical protein